MCFNNIQSHVCFLNLGENVGGEKPDHRMSEKVYSGASTTEWKLEHETSRWTDKPRGNFAKVL